MDRQPCFVFPKLDLVQAILVTSSYSQQSWERESLRNFVICLTELIDRIVIGCLDEMQKCLRAWFLNFSLSKLMVARVK